MPAYPGMRRRIPSSGRLLDQAGSVTSSPSTAGEGAAPLPAFYTSLQAGTWDRRLAFSTEA